MWNFSGIAQLLLALGRTIWGLFAKYLPGIVAQCLLAFGMTVVVNHYAGDDIHGLFLSLFAGLPSNVGKLVGIMKFDKAVTVILSAIAVKVATSVAIRAKPPATP